MSTTQDEKTKHESFQKRMKYVTRSWDKIEKNLDMYRQKISDDYFQAHPYKNLLLKQTEVKEGEDYEELFRKKFFKHSVAVINCLGLIVDFVNGNEESKPIFFVLGRQHKQALLNEKMFLEMKDSICRVFEEHLGEDSARAWELVLEYIFVNYVFPGMGMIPAS